MGHKLSIVITFINDVIPFPFSKEIVLGQLKVNIEISIFDLVSNQKREI